jgi:hypothetical protein
MKKESGAIYHEGTGWWDLDAARAAHCRHGCAHAGERKVVELHPSSTRHEAVEAGKLLAQAHAYRRIVDELQAGWAIWLKVTAERRYWPRKKGHPYDDIRSSAS